MFNKILVPLDGSELAERALASAFTLAAQAEGEVHLLRVCAPEKMLVPNTPVFGGYGLLWPDQALETAEEEARAYLAAIQKSKAPRPVRVRAQVFEGGVAEAIVDTAVADKMDLIVMSSHGYSGLTRWVLGSVAEKVLRSAPCPVLVIRSPEPVRRVLIPLDGSALSEQALAPGLELAERLGCEVTLLRAIPKLETREIERLDQAERGLGLRAEAEMREDAEHYLRNLIAIRPHQGLKIKIAVTHEPAAQSVLEFAESQAMNVIVMSTHGRTGLARWVYGSVTEKVLRGTPASMLIVRPAARDLG
jgi:nucleotide-binding universal stress UspA family protein